MKAIARALASLQAKPDSQGGAPSPAKPSEHPHKSRSQCKQDSSQHSNVAAACRRNTGYDALRPSAQSSAAQTPSASRGGSGEHERGRSSGATTACLSSSGRSSLESRAFVKSSVRHPSLDALSAVKCPKPAAEERTSSSKPSSTWFSHGVPSKQQEHEQTRTTELQQELQQEALCHVSDSESGSQQQPQPTQQADALPEEADLEAEQHCDDEFPSLKSIIGSMRLHIDHPVAHPSNERGCVFKAYWSNACVAAKISISAKPPPMLTATGPTAAELNHPNIVQTFESRTGRVSKEFLQSPCALSAFSSCSEAMEQLCPIGVMKAELAAAGMPADAMQAELAAAGAPPGVHASTAAAAALLGARSPADSTRTHAAHHYHPQQQQQQQQQQESHGREQHTGALPAGAGGHAQAGDVEMIEVVTSLSCDEQQQQQQQLGALKDLASVTCWSDSDDSCEEKAEPGERSVDEKGQDRESGSTGKGSIMQMLFDSGDGFGPLNKASAQRTAPMEWGQIMKAAGVQAGDYVTLTLMDWCDCGSLHHAMAHAVFSLAPSRPTSSCGTPAEAPLTPTPTAETAQSASQMDTDTESQRACLQHGVPSTAAPADASCGDDSMGASAHTDAVAPGGRATTAGSSSDGGSGSAAEARMCVGAGSSSGESCSGCSSNSMRGMRTRYRGLLRTARDIAQGLEHLHCCGIVHGALEPSNVLLKGSPTDARGFVARLSNFNTSLASAATAPSEFTAPEIRGGKVTRIDPAADMWSFGHLLRVMVIKSLEAAHPGHDFGHTFSPDPEAKAPDAKSPRPRSSTSATNSTAAMSTSSRQQEAGTAPAALIPQELTDLYHRCVRADPAERPSAHEAIVVLVTMEMRLRSKLSKQVLQQQQALKQQWEEQAEAVQLQLQQAQAAQWAQLQPWASAHEASQLNVRQLQQHRLHQQLQAEQQQQQQQQQQQLQGHRPPACSLLHSQQQQQQQQRLELAHEHCVEQQLLLREQEHELHTQQQQQQQQGLELAREHCVELHTQQQQQQQQRLELSHEHCAEQQLQEQEVQQEQGGHKEVDACSSLSHHRQYQQSNHHHHHHHHHSRHHRHSHQNCHTPTSARHTHHHHHHHHPPHAQPLEREQENRIQQQQQQLLQDQPHHPHPNLHAYHPQQQHQQQQQLLLLQGQPHTLLQYPSMSSYPQQQHQQDRLQGLLQRLDAQHQQQHYQQQQRACYPSHLLAARAAGPLADLTPMPGPPSSSPAAPAAATPAAALSSSHAGTSTYGCGMSSPAEATRTHACVRTPCGSASPSPTPASNTAAAAAGLRSTPGTWARTNAAAATDALLQEHKFDAQVHHSPHQRHAAGSLPSKVSSFGSSNNAGGGASPPSTFAGRSAAIPSALKAGSAGSPAAMLGGNAANPSALVGGSSASPSVFTGASAAGAAGLPPPSVFAHGSPGLSGNGGSSLAASSMSTGFNKAEAGADAVHLLASCAARGAAGQITQPVPQAGQQQQHAEQWAWQELAIQVLTQQVEVLRKCLQQQQQQQHALSQGHAQAPLGHTPYPQELPHPLHELLYLQQRCPWNARRPHPPAPPNSCTLTTQLPQQQQQQQQVLPTGVPHVPPQPLLLGAHVHHHEQQQQQQSQRPSVPLTAAALVLHNKHYQQQEQQQQSLPQSPLPRSQGQQREQQQCRKRTEQQQHHHHQQQQQHQQLTAAALRQHQAAQQRQQQQLTNVAMQLHAHLHRQLDQQQQHGACVTTAATAAMSPHLCQRQHHLEQVVGSGLDTTSTMPRGCGAAGDDADQSGVLPALGGQRLIAAERALQEATRAARVAGQAVTEAVEAASAAKLGQA